MTMIQYNSTEEGGTTELSSEEEFYDTVAERLFSIDLTVTDPSRFLSGSVDAFKYMLQRIGPVEGRKVLDYGCGSGWLGVYLAKRGAQVEGFDISGKLVEVASLRAKVNGVAHTCKFTKMRAEQLQYRDESFDIVVGISILHHIELVPAARELHRVMKNGSSAIFIEPLGENSILNFVRNKIIQVHHGLLKDKATEHPLTYQDIAQIGQHFAEYRWREFQLFSMISRFVGDRLVDILQLRKIDDYLLRSFPGFRGFCRLVVVEFWKGI